MGERAITNLFRVFTAKCAIHLKYAVKSMVLGLLSRTTRGLTLTPTQPDVVRIEKVMLAELQEAKEV